MDVSLERKGDFHSTVILRASSMRRMWHGIIVCAKTFLDDKCRTLMLKIREVNWNQNAICLLQDLS